MAGQLDSSEKRGLIDGSGDGHRDLAAGRFNRNDANAVNFAELSGGPADAASEARPHDCKSRCIQHDFPNQSNPRRGCTNRSCGTAIALQNTPRGI